jgi:hypothetical protein
MVRASIFIISIYTIFMWAQLEKRNCSRSKEQLIQTRVCHALPSCTFSFGMKKIHDYMQRWFSTCEGNSKDLITMSETGIYIKITTSEKKKCSIFSIKERSQLKPTIVFYYSLPSANYKFCTTTGWFKIMISSVFQINIMSPLGKLLPSCTWFSNGFGRFLFQIS